MPISGVQPTCDHIHTYYQRKFPILFPSIVSKEKLIKKILNVLIIQMSFSIYIYTFIPGERAIAWRAKESFVLIFISPAIQMSRRGIRVEIARSIFVPENEKSGEAGAGLATV